MAIGVASKGISSRARRLLTLLGALKVAAVAGRVLTRRQTTKRFVLAGSPPFATSPRIRRPYPAPFRASRVRHAYR